MFSKQELICYKNNEIYKRKYVIKQNAEFRSAAT